MSVTKKDLTQLVEENKELGLFHVGKTVYRTVGIVKCVPQIESILSGRTYLESCRMLNCWLAGHKSGGREMKDKLFNQVRRQKEAQDNGGRNWIL